MTDLSNIDTFRIRLKPEDADWTTNDREYLFQPVNQQGLAVSFAKRTNRKIEIKLFGPYNTNFWFKADIPVCGPEGLWVELHWKDGNVDLLLNGQVVDTKHKDDLLFDYSGPAFASATDEATRASELAVAFDLAAKVLTGALLAQAHVIEILPSFAIPLVVCDAFAIELYLKAFHQLDNGRRAGGHDLRDLFDALLPATQQKIRDVYAQKPAGFVIPNGISMAFDDVLNDCAKGFVQWRYSYETGKSETESSYHPGAIRAALQSVARELFPNAFSFEKKPPGPTSPPQ